MKKILKFLIITICFLFLSPVIVVYFLLAFFGHKDSVLWTFSQFLSLIPGKTGSYIRKSFYSVALKKCSLNCAIMFGTIFSQVNTEIESGVYIGPQSNIGKCLIEKNCIIGSGVHIVSGTKQHNFYDLDKPIRDQSGTFKKITLGENSWIGNCAIIMANIGKNCIVGAGSVVTKDVDDYSIVAGNPAKLIHKRQ